MSRHPAHTVSRRTLLGRALAGVAGIGAMAVVGCGESSSSKTATSTATALPGPTKPALSPTAQRKATWSDLSPAVAPSARRDHSMTLDRDTGLIYLFGGRRAGVSMNDLWAFDPKLATWREIAVSGAAPPARFAPVAVFDQRQKRLVISTGQGDGSVFFNDVWVFDPASASWSQLGAGAAERPEIRYGAGGAFDPSQGRIFISHGFTDRGRFDDTWSFDLAADKWTQLPTTGPVPIKRCLTRCLWVADRGALLLFGGQTDATPFLGDFWSLDVAGGTWTEKKSAVMPGPRNLYGASVDPAGNEWYIFGGNTAAGPTAETWKYDIAADAWTQVEASSPPPARYSTDAAIAGTRLYAFGGHDGNAEIGDTRALQISA